MKIPVTVRNTPRLEKPVALYDGQCAFCREVKARVEGLDFDHRVEWLDLRSCDAQRRFPRIDWQRAEEEIHLVHTNGRVRVGSRAIRDIIDLIGGPPGRLAALAMDLPLGRLASDLAYRAVSDHRSFLSRFISSPSQEDCSCGVPSASR